ncbi:MAG TPA: hypothetical protein VHY19_15420 [Steroidobacteraceae bacterium]|nr:hypothetical protein [Steroidobacteraceae bacterium]
MKKKADPAGTEAQALVVRWNKLAVRYGLRSRTAALLEWNASFALEWMQLSERAMLFMGASEPPAPDEGPDAYLRAAQVPK